MTGGTGQAAKEEPILRAEIARLRAALARAEAAAAGAEGDRQALRAATGMADNLRAANAALEASRIAQVESEERWRAILGSATEYAIITFDPAGTVTGWSPGAAAMTGWAAEEMAGRSGDVLWTPEDLVADIPGVERRTALHQGRAPDERWHLRRDGTRFWGSGHMTPLRQGGTGGFLKIMRDRTAERRAGEALAASETRGAFLLRLGDALRSRRRTGEIVATASRMLGEHLVLDRVAWADMDVAGGVAVIHRDWVRGAFPSIAGPHPLDAFGTTMLRRLLDGRTVVVPDARADPATADGAGAWDRLGVRGLVAVPLVKDGVLVSLLALHVGVPRPWTPAEVTLVEEVAERLWEAVERAHAETALAASEELFRGFAENSADVLWILDARTRRLEYLSPAFDGMFGEGRDRVMADLSRWRDLVHPEDREAGAAFLPRTLAGEVAVAHYRIIRPSDGGVAYLRDTGFPIRGRGGAVRRIGGIVQDISDIQRTGAALEAEKDRFRTLVETIPQLVWRADAAGRWIWASPQWLDYTGQTFEESTGLGWLDAAHPGDRDAILRAMRDAVPTGRLDLEYRVRRVTDGAWRWHRTRSVPLRDLPEGGILEWFGTTTDIEDLKRLHSEQGVLLAELQHRTRNLLAVVQAIAARSLPGTPERAVFVGRLVAMGRVQGFLARSGRWSVPLRDLVEAELAAAGAGPDRVTVSGPPVDLPGDLAQAVALAVHELATNAAKHGALAQPGGRLEVTWRVEAAGARDRLVLGWTESGVAMPGGTPRRGYGSELLERALPYQFHADTNIDRTNDGIRCRIVLPLQRAATDGDG